MKTACITLAMCLTAGFASASTIMPVSYDMPNGGIGTFSYLDSGYDGEGSSNTPGAPLSGGLGKLTDGTIATQNWNAQPGVYVGWQIDPVITFNFDQAYSFTSMTFHFDDSGFGGVSQPTSVNINGTAYTVPTNPGAAPFVFTADLGGVINDQLAVQIFRSPTSSWVFLSEVSFSGAAQAAPSSPSAVPLPASSLLLFSALGGFFVMRRRRG